MPKPSEPKVIIKAAAAAAIVTTARLSDELRAKVDAGHKFAVHPHVAAVRQNDALLNGYLRTIYARRLSLGASYPAEGPFRRLTSAATASDATRELAQRLAVEMSKKNANPGILFGFTLELEGSAVAHGVVKADLDDEQRFHFQTLADGQWSLDAVRYMLPPPRTDYAKFAIAPQPGGDAAVGVHDVSDSASAADYFLKAISLTVPRVRGTKAAVAQAALDAGYSQTLVRKHLKELKDDTAVDELVSRAFPDIPDKRRESLKGSATRPMTSVRANDSYISVYRTRSPRFELLVDESVEVKVEGRVVTATLPEDSDPIEYRARR